MGAEVTTIDFKELKRNLIGSSADSPVNCAVALFSDKSVGLRVSKKTPGKVLARELKVSAGSDGLMHFYGTAYVDTYPGTLRLDLNKAPDSLATRLRYALRGSGFGSVEVSEIPME